MLSFTTGVLAVVNLFFGEYTHKLNWLVYFIELRLLPAAGYCAGADTWALFSTATGGASVCAGGLRLFYNTTNTGENYFQLVYF